MVADQDQFTPKGLRLFYLSLVGLVVLIVFMTAAVGVFVRRDQDLVPYVRTLMVRSWWMVVSGMVTFSTAYMVMAFLSAVGKGLSQPLKPRLGAVFVVTLSFAAFHCLRLAYGENFLYNFLVIFAKDFLGIALALLPTLSQPIRGRMYGTKERLWRSG